MAEDDGVEVGFEEGMSWLIPTQVLDEACDIGSKEYLKNKRQPQNGHLRSAEPILLQPKSSLKPNHRPRHSTNWATGGPGMQAVFLDSGQRSCGTGVFLPRRAGTDLHPSNKPACSPVLLPSRVVQALNLNVHELGLQFKSRRDTNNDSNSVDGKAISNGKKGKDASTHQCCVISQSRNSSPDIFLPKEWTY